MQSQHDWAQIEDEDDDDETYSQESDHREEQQRPQPQEQYQEPQNQTTEAPVHYESRPSGYRGGGEGRGNRGDRRGRGGRENRGDRNNRRENREGPRQGDRPKQPMESQSKQEMLNLIKRQRDTTTMITVFNVAFNSTAEDVKALYPEVKFKSDREPKPGVFVFEFDQDEALKFTEIGGKVLNGREFFIKLSYENQANNPEQYHAGGRPDKYKYDDKPRRGGGGGPGGERRNNNRREYNQEHGGGDSYNKPRGGQNYNKDRPQDYGNKRPQQYNRDRGDDHHQHQHHHDFRRAEPTKIDTDNKFFRNHDLQANEFNIRFMKSVSLPAKENSANQSHEHHEEAPKPTELVQAQSTGPKVAKPNPFGDAKPRDENEYLKKKELEEKKVDVVEKKNPFEGKKEQPPKFEPKIVTKPQPVVEDKPVETKPVEEPAPVKQEYEKKQDRRQDNRPYKEKRDNYYEKKGGNYGDNRRGTGGERKYNKEPVNEEALNDYADDDYENGNDDYGNYDNFYKQYQKSHKHERYDEGEGEEGHLETEEKYADKPPRQDKNPLQISHYRSEGGHQKPRGYGRGGRGGGDRGSRGGRGRGGGNTRGGGGYNQVVYEEKAQERPQYTKKNSYNESKNENKATTPQNQSQGQSQAQKGKGRTMDKFNVFDHFDIKKD